jgi:pimeloyl-ACP methyl ester carboxylesterase
MAYTEDDQARGHLPVIYVRGFAGGASGISSAVEDPFYGFNEGSVQVRVDKKDRPVFHQFESPLLRLMIDEDYRLLVRGDQRSYLQTQENGTVPAATLWVHRFYDEFASTLTKNPNAFSLERAAESLLSFVLDVRAKTGAPRVFLVAHSMGGLVVRCLLQKIIPEHPDLGGRLDAGADVVDRVFTYATPHGGIEFAVGMGLLERLRDVTGLFGADIFGPRRMQEYLTPVGVPGAETGSDAPFDATRVPDGGYPLDRIFCLVGTNASDYSAAMGLSSQAVGAASDGLVQIDNAHVRGAPRSLVHRSHSGRFGIVNSEEGYQNLRRFLFGDLAVRADLVDLDLPGDPDDETVWQLETSLSIRGLPAILHEQSTAHLCPIQIERPRTEDDPYTPVPLVTTFLSASAGRPKDPHTGDRITTMRHVLRLRLLSLRERGGILFWTDHLEQTEDWADVLVVDIALNGPDSGCTWATWNSEIAGAIRDWDPAGTPPLRDVDERPGHWRVRVPVPRGAAHILGEGAAVEITVDGRATLDHER